MSALADSPRTILQTLANKVVEVLHADSAGLSLLTKDQKRFYWAAIAGAWSPYLGGGSPRDFGPCGDVLDHNAPMLFTHWERRYPYLRSATPLAEEGLLVPFYVEGKAVGTIWAIVHDKGRRFDGEDLRLLESMGHFASTGVQAIESIEKLQTEIRVNQRLEASERTLVEFFAEAPIGLLWVAPDGRILGANHALASILRCPADELCGRLLVEFCAEPRRIASAIERLAKKKTLREFRLQLRRGKDSLVHVLVDANGLWEKGRLVHLRWFVRDVSQQVELQREILTVGERVRRRIGHDLHDDLCQRLTSIEFLTRALERRLYAQAPNEVLRTKEISQLIRQAIVYTRELSHRMSPMELETKSLTDALKTLAAGTRKLFNVSCRFLGNSAMSVEDGMVRIHLYRIAQEAINNAIKHGKAKRLWLSVAAKDNRLLLSVQDDGVGMPKRLPKHLGFGLRIMQYRANTLEGDLVVRRRNGGGTVVTCSIPVIAAGPARQVAPYEN